MKKKPDDELHIGMSNWDAVNLLDKRIKDVKRQFLIQHIINNILFMFVFGCVWFLVDTDKQALEMLETLAVQDRTLLQLIREMMELR